MKSSSSHPSLPERFVRHLWQHQLFTGNNLRTADGRSVTVLSPGAPNNDAGPDFLDARIRIGPITFCGDIEIHRNAASWEEHSHGTDPHYNRVILHVVLMAGDPAPVACTASRRALPLLILHPYLDPASSAAWVPSMLGDGTGLSGTLKCHGRNAHVPAPLIMRWIERLSRERLEMKLQRCEERLKELVDEERSVLREPYPRYYGDPREIPWKGPVYTARDFSLKAPWEQLLYEGIMEGMGYAKNSGQFLQLGRTVRLSLLRRHGLGDAPTMMAILFGAAGLLPSQRTLHDPECRRYVRDLKRRWKVLDPPARNRVLHEGDWLFFRLRPYNFPTARLATICFLLPALFGEESFRGIIGAMKNQPGSPRDRLRAIRALFAFRADDFWSRHSHFRDAAGRCGIALGEARIIDLMVNAILPTALLYARIFRDHALRENAWELLAAMPAPQENSVTQLLGRQLPMGKADSALLQQGGLQLYKFYCTQNRCGDCPVGKEVGISAGG